MAELQTSRPRSFEVATARKRMKRPFELKAVILQSVIIAVRRSEHRYGNASRKLNEPIFA